jgi:hypothetical protein
VHLELSVFVDIDGHGHNVRLVLTGHLSETNQQGLYLLIRNGRRLTPGTRVIVDLTGLHAADPHAVDLLRWEADHDPTCGGPVRVLNHRPRPAPP